MMKYFKIKPNTEEYKNADKVFSTPKKWINTSVIKDFENAICIPVDKNMVCYPYELRLKRIPDGIKNQFKKYKDINGYYCAKKDSDCNRRFLEIVKKHNLELFTISHFAFSFKHSGVKVLHPIIIKGIKTQYIIEVSLNIEWFLQHDSLEAITNIEFHELKKQHYENEAKT